MTRILAIDDNEDNLITLSALLRSRFPDVQVDTSLSPREGMELAVSGLPDLIILDYIMPELNGIELCSRLKSHSYTSHIPVILLTASETTPRKRASGLEAGADAFLSKPIDEVELAAQVSAMLRIKKSEDELREKNSQLEHVLQEKTARLGRTERNYESLFNSINDIVIIFDLEGFILEINSFGLRYFGLDEKDIIGTSVMNLFVGDFLDNKTIMNGLDNTLDKRWFESVLQNPSGKKVPVEVMNRMVEYNNDDAILSIFHDISARRNIGELREILSAVVDSTDEAVIGVTINGTVVSWNSSAERIFGYKPDEINGCSFTELIPPFQPNDFPQLLERIRNGIRVDNYESVGMTRDGRQVSLSMKITPIADSSGRIIGASILERDLTSEVRARETIRRGKDFLKSLEDVNPAFYIAIDAKGNILTMNKAMLIGLNYSIREVVGKNYIDLLFHESDRDIQSRDFQNIIKKKKYSVSEYSIRTKNGNEVLVEWHGKPLINVKGELEFIFYVGIDITQRKHLEKVIMETNASERLKIGQELHDRLALHLAGIMFKGELLKLKISDSPDEALADVDVIVEMVNQAVNRTRELAKELSPVDIGHGGLRAAVENLKDEIKDKDNVNILIRWDSSVEISGKLEISNFYYIIRESVLNSIENNRSRNIVIDLIKENNISVLTIRDDGIDVDRIDRNRNELFISLIKYRSWLIGASTEIKGNPGGGISIVCRYKLTGEPIDHESSPSVFARNKKDAGSGSTVLVADSHPVVRRGLSQIIRGESDITVSGEASNSDEALKLIGRTRPDIMTVDIALTGTSGIDLIKACRDRYPTLPILVLSVYDESLYAERAIRAGARGYVMKSEPPQVILNAIRTVLEGRQYMSDSLKERLLDRLYVATGKDEASAMVDSLTDREFEVFQLTGHGLSNRHIADKLHISVKTVENYREKIKSKLNMGTSSELMQFAVQWVINKTG